MAFRRTDPDLFRARAAELAWLTLVFFLAALFALVAFGAFGLESLLPAFAAAGVVLGLLAWRQARAETLPPSLRRPSFAEWAAKADAEELEPEDVPDGEDEFHAARERLLHHIEERKRGGTAADR